MNAFVFGPLRLIRTVVLAAITPLCIVPCARAQQGGARGADETAYAVAVTLVADSAIHRLDFFPARAQLRMQMMLLAPNDTTAAVFFEVARRSELAATSLDETASRFERIDVPDDLGALHHTLLASLYAARGALDRLGAAAKVCELDATSVSRCQTPFTAASSAIATAYSRYLETRARIARQITDTQTQLPAFVLSARR